MIKFSTAFFILVAVSGSVFGQPTCKIEPVNPSYSKEGAVTGFLYEPGIIIEAGDLKIRVLTKDVLELKWPNGRQAYNYKPDGVLAVKVCGQEVTISTPDIGQFKRMFRVGVF